MSETGKHDPGWNDPPMFSYNPEAPPIKPKNLLNKRVPFGVNSSPVSAESKQPLSMPPTAQLSIINRNSLPNLEYPTASAPPPTNQLPFPSLPSEKVVENSTSDNFEETINIFKTLISNSPELGKKIADIEKRLSIMESMWKDGKLNDDVCTRTTQIAKALQSSDTKAADEIHKSLMVDHISVVSPWMVAVKQLIFHYIAKNDLLAIDDQ